MKSLSVQTSVSEIDKAIASWKGQKFQLLLLFTSRDILQDSDLVGNARWLGVPVRWRAFIREFDPPDRFLDVQLRGAQQQLAVAKRNADNQQRTLELTVRFTSDDLPRWLRRLPRRWSMPSGRAFRSTRRACSAAMKRTPQSCRCWKPPNGTSECD